jgi:hypothetical protein
VHHLIPGAAHHQDLRFGDPRDAPSVAVAKAMELAAMQKWIAEA